MTDSDILDTAPSSSGQVPFGKFMAIDPNRRLPQYDNGRSYAYEAIDNRDRSKKFIAFVADVGQLPRWQSVDAYNSLSDTSFMRLVGSGVLRWPPVKKQQFVFVYQGGLGECLVKAGAFSKAPWRLNDITNNLIAPMANMLKEMAERGFAHGSIRPDNIFYGSVEKNKPVLLGDCLSVQPSSTQPSVFLPIDRALAYPLGRGNGALVEDVYAFGVTLAFFLRKHDELAGLNDEAIVRKKIDVGSFTTIVGAERFQPTFLEMLRGMLHDDPVLRWGLDEIFSWLDGSRLTPPALSRRVKANRPITFQGKKYLYPDVLALDLPKNTAETVKMVENGELTQWVEKSFNDKDIEENYSKALERISSIGQVKDNSDFAVTQLCLAFNPVLPVHYKGLSLAYDGLGALMARTAYEGADLEIFKDILMQNILDHAVTMKPLTQSDILAYIKSYDTCRAALRQKARGKGIERCIYMMCRNAPCLSPQFKDFFVHNEKSLLLTFEYLSKNKGQVAIFLDAHCIAFFATHNARLMERVVYDLNSQDKNQQIIGNLRFMAVLQKTTKIGALPAIANVFLGALSGVYKTYNNTKLRQQVEEGVKFEAKEGDLVGMSTLIDNDNARKKDRHLFDIAKREYKMLQDEYNLLNKKLAHKKSYGVVNGRDAAALVSWTVATGITLMSVFAFLAGYSIF